MYNLANLNDYEFEVLCKDIMEKKLSTLLHRFGKGKDGGIDLCDSKNPIQYMIQVKHYINSKYSDLRIALKKEITKVEIENPQNYYVCCSIELSPQQRREIVSLFPKYMKDISFVIDKTEIDDFLSKEENNDIVEKHYKLWLCSSNVLSLVQNQHVFIDCNEILNDIEKYTKLFVTTKAYFECRNKLLDGNIIIIIGTPGVGKSTISKMLLLFFASNDYIVRYVTDNNIKDIKNVLTQDPSKKEIILLDDFLGQHYLNLTDKQPNELKTLISFIERNPNKKIILNSRITIINEAYSSSINFANLFEEYEKDNYLIDLDKMSELEKAEILYNHLYFNELPHEYLSQIKTNKNYAKIIKHKNYNPRIIEYITKPKNYTNISPEDYIDYVLSKLNNPDSVWEDEFRNRLEENDRILMNTLYSLTNTKIEINVLRTAFNKRLLATIPSTTINTFEEVISRLSNSLIQVVVEKEKRYISVINPSVNDYLKKKIETNENEQLTIINNSKYIEQIMKFMQNKKRICEIIYNNELEEISSVDKSPSYYYLKLIIDYELKDIKLIEFVALALENICLNFSWIYDDLIVELILKDYINIYNLEQILVNNLANIAVRFSFDNLLELYKWHLSKTNLTDTELEIYKNSFSQAIQEHVLDLINEELQEIVVREINSSDLDIDDSSVTSLDDRKELYIQEYLPYVEETIKHKINNHLKGMIDKTPIDITVNDIDYDYIFYNIDIDDSINSYADNEYAEWQADYYVDTEKYTPSENDWNIIDKIFS